MIGLVGSGNMALALARGWAEPVLATDGGSGRAKALVAEVGGEALESNAELAQRADAVVLCHKPYQLEQVAEEVAPHARRVFSVLGGTTLEQLRTSYPDALVVRALPNTPVEVRRGVTCLAEGDGTEEARELFGRVGDVVVMPERLMPVAGATMGVSPAYVALLVEAHVDAAIKHGLTPDLASVLAVQALEGSAALIRHRGDDTLAVRRGVTSPGGTTARGLAALEAHGVRSAMMAAMDAVMDR
jgi:pyrroline-5-carboxylate reductase